MMIVLIDGFEHYGPGPLMVSQGGYLSTSGVSIVPGAGRFGGPAARIEAGANNSGLRFNVRTSCTTAGFGFALDCTSLPSGEGLALFQATGRAGSPVRDVHLLTLTVLPTGALVMRCALSETISGGLFGPIVEVSAPVLVAGSSQFVAGAFEFMSSGIIYRVAVDGGVVLSGFSPYDTPGPITTVPIYLMAAGCMGYPKTGAKPIVVSDLTLVANEPVASPPPLDRRVWTSMPAADGPDQDWQLFGAATAAEVLSSIPPADSTRFLFSGDTGDRVAVLPNALPTDAVEISAVAVRGRAWGSAASQLALQVVSGAAETVFDPVQLDARPAWYGVMAETDPASGSPWAVADVNAIQVVLAHS